MELTIDNQFACCFIGIADTLEVASVGDLGVLDHHLAFATLLHDRDALVCLQWLVVLEPGNELKNNVTISHLEVISLKYLKRKSKGYINDQSEKER